MVTFTANGFRVSTPAASSASRGATNNKRYVPESRGVQREPYVGRTNIRDIPAAAALQLRLELALVVPGQQSDVADRDDLRIGPAAHLRRQE